MFVFRSIAAMLGRCENSTFVIKTRTFQLVLYTIVRQLSSVSIFEKQSFLSIYT